MEEKKENKVVISKPAVIEEKKGWDKVADSFFNEDKQNIKNYIIYDVLLPAAKKTIQTIVTNVTSMVLYGEADKRNNQSDIPVSRVSYRSYYNEPAKSSYYNQDRYSQRTQPIADYNNILLENRGDCEILLDQMNATIEKYTFVKVADLFDFVGLKSNYTDNNWGWTDLRSAEICRQSDGRYWIRFPKPMPID